ncbi:MAG: hypothetical protein R3A52_31300 [Polyangiales bacterium]
MFVDLGSAVRTVSGGTARYVGVSLWPCPENPDYAGECASRCAIEVMWGDAVMESHALRAGAVVLVRDGDELRPGTPIAQWSPGLRRYRAPLGDGVEAVATWSEEPAREEVDDITGLARWRFAEAGDDVTLSLAVGDTVTTITVPRAAVPKVASGSRVRNGEVIAERYAPPFERFGVNGMEGLRALLDARAPRGVPLAAVAPCDGVVTAIEPRWVRVRDEAGRELRVHRGRWSEASVEVGDEVSAGDALEWGHRSHHRLLRAWGEARLRDHMLEEIEYATAMRGVEVRASDWSLALRAMFGWRRVLDAGDTGLPKGAVIERAVVERAQREARARGGREATVVTVLRGARWMALRKRRSPAT